MNEILLLSGIVVYLLIGQALHFIGLIRDRDQLIWPVSLVKGAVTYSGNSELLETKKQLR